MVDRRVEARMLCADLIEVGWIDRAGGHRKTTANLEDISLSGACVQVDVPVPRDTLMRIAHPKAELQGRVRYCVYRDGGYFLGIQFEPGVRWSRSLFRPKHMLDPRTLVEHALKRAKRKA